MTERATETKTARKGWKKVWDIFTTVLVVLIVALVLALVGARLFGLTPYVVLSGSMEPALPVGSLIYDAKIAPEDVQVGDPITYVLDESLTVVTHRVVEIYLDEDTGERYFFVKGDANDLPDGRPVYEKNLLGAVRFMIPKLGYVVHVIRDKPICYITWSIIAVVVILAFVPDLIKKADEKDKAKAAAKAAEENGGGGDR